MKQYSNIDEYFGNFPDSVQKTLNQIRATIHKAIPSAEEAIRYGIPTFRLDDKNLVHFAAYAKHIGFYPGAAAIEVFKSDLTEYQLSKGTIQFPIDKKVPLKLITTITKFRVSQIREKQLFHY